MAPKYKYRISSNSFHGNYTFLNLEIQRSQYIKVWKLFKGGNYMRIYGNDYRKNLIFKNCPPCPYIKHLRVVDESDI